MHRSTDHQALAGVEIRDTAIARVHQAANAVARLGHTELAAELASAADDLETSLALIGGAR